MCGHGRDRWVIHVVELGQFAAPLVDGFMLLGRSSGLALGNRSPPVGFALPCGVGTLLKLSL